MPGKYFKQLNVILYAIIFILGGMLGATSVQHSWRLDAAYTECAQFNPENGQFEWVAQ